MNIGIVGHGFVGKAIDFAFTHPDVNKTIIDPIYGTKLSDLNNPVMDLVFVCVPTPIDINTGKVDAGLVVRIVKKLLKNTVTKMVVIKSTITPDIVEELIPPQYSGRVLYNPEFLTERSANEQFVNAKYHIIGGYSSVASELVEHYKTYSRCDAYQYITVTPRIGSSHTKVPGFDLKKGFGGGCLPKDILALLKFSDNQMSLLQSVIDINNSIRKDYDLDIRESNNKINFKS